MSSAFLIRGFRWPVTYTGTYATVYPDPTPLHEVAYTGYGF